MTIDILNSNIIALVPVYRENEAELHQTISSFQHMNAGLRVHLVLIVDGIRDSLPSLHKLLGLNEFPQYQTHASYDVITGNLSCCNNTEIAFHLIVKHAHGGKRDSIAWFLQLVMDSVEINLAELKNRYPGFTALETLLNKHELSLFIVDSDTHFAPDALHYLYQTLWHEDYQNVYCATPALSGRFDNYLDFFRLGQNAEYEIMNYFVLSYLVNGESVASDKLLFGLQACGLLKAAFLMDNAVIIAYSKKANTFKEAITYDMNEDTFLSMLIRQKNPKLIYVPKANVSTVFPATLGNFLIQRKRWRNGNLLQQKALKQQKLRQTPFFKKIILRSINLLKKIFYSPAAYFYLLLSIVSVAWGHYFDLTIAAKNGIFFIFLVGITVITLFFKVSRFPRLYDAIALFSAATNIFIYVSLIAIVVNIFQGNGSLLAWLALIAKGLTPLIMLAVMLRKKAGRLALFIGLIIKYVLLDPIYYLIFPVYSVAKLDDLSWNLQNAADNKKKQALTFLHEGKNIKRKALSYFLLENLIFSLLLSQVSIGFILGFFAMSEILQWFVLLLGPLIAEVTQHRPVYPQKSSQDAV